MIIIIIIFFLKIKRLTLYIYIFPFKVKLPVSSIQIKTLSKEDDTILSSLDQNPSTTNKYNSENINNEINDKNTHDRDLFERLEDKKKEEKELLTKEDLEKAYDNFCLLIVDIDSIDYVEMTYFPRKKTTFYKIECPYFSTEDEKTLHNKKENYFYRNNNKYDEKNLHKHYDNFNSIYPSMSTKQENIGYEPFTGNQIQNTSYIFDNNEPMSKISKNQTIYKKVYWIKKKD
ncbi:hypothetical protein PIROE2DRAFT_65174 [Piromyces sp. E2]|nr:hypothetical protein PIROE2DRAFT_65174 [Piromyces sp. E2]|eukprot:OUM57136.1 hypothetical protein PIROE2DRAFT_65174 [Piromyces sp. E2]